MNKDGRARRRLTQHKKGMVFLSNLKMPKLSLIENPEIQGRHAVILGAGASRQAFPQGDANGNRVPLMNDFDELFGISKMLKDSDIHISHTDFEGLYSTLIRKYTNHPIIKRIEDRIYYYFSSLQLPNYPTLYDHLLISLRPKDYIFTFNWDPFLFDTWNRWNNILPLPAIFYLHGNVRIGYCKEHLVYGAKTQSCPSCRQKLKPIPIIYPVENKEYGNAFLKAQWEVLNKALSETHILTIFGYSAPTTDIRAIRAMESAWSRDNKFIERIEVINTQSRDELKNTWDPFIIRTYFDYEQDFYNSRIALNPRRTCEQFIHTQYEW